MPDFATHTTHATRPFVLTAAALFLAGCGPTAPATTAPEVVKCEGINSCKGQGQCASPAGTDPQAAGPGAEAAGNACGGQNACAGKGWIESPRAECQAGGGTVLGVVKSASADACANSTKRLADAEAQDQYNLARDGLAISGYDPVTYFSEGGGKPTPGKPELTTSHAGATYRFATEENRKLFVADPSKYEPAYGGWCAYALGKTGRRVKPDPESFVVEDGALLLFYRTGFNDTRAKWAEEGPDKLRPRATSAWAERTGECR